VVTFTELDVKLREIEELVERDYRLLTDNLGSVSQRFTQLYREYLEVSKGAVLDFVDGIARLRQGEFLSGGIKLLKSAIKGGVAWWKRESWFRNFISALEEIYSNRLAIIEQKLKDIELVEKEHIPFVRDTARKLLEHIASYSSFSDPTLKEKAVDRAESVAEVLIKTYYISGVGQFLKSAYEDARNARVIAGDASLIRGEFLKGISDVKKLLESLSPSDDSPLMEVIRRNRVFGGNDGQD